MTHGQKILEALRANMQQLGRKPSDVESAAVIDGYLADAALKLKKVRKASAPKVRARDEIFDLLARCDGQTGALTRHAGSRIATAKKQILEVMPEASAVDVVVEIEKRWARFCRKYTEKRMQTAMALVGHWGEFADADATDRRRTRAEQMNIYAVPSFDWQPIAVKVLNVRDPDAMKDKNWDDLSPDLRLAILQAEAKKAR